MRGNGFQENNARNLKRAIEVQVRLRYKGQLVQAKTFKEQVKKQIEHDVRKEFMLQHNLCDRGLLI